MRDKSISAEFLGSSDEVSVHGWAEGTNREVIIVSGQGQDVIVLASAVLGDDFRTKIDGVVPAALMEAVLEWLRRE